MPRSALLVLLFLAQAGDGDPPPRRIPLEPVRLERLPSSPRRTLRPARALEDGLTIAGTRFAVELEDSAPRVATESGDDPTRRVRNGTVLAFEPLGAAGDAATVELLFERRGGRWLWGAASARRFELDGLELCLVDVDADGGFDLLHDGWSLGVGGPLLPLAPVLLIDDRELRIERLARDGGELVARVVALPGTPVQRAALARLNRLRVGEGLAAVRLEPELGEGCRLHAEYLARRSWSGGDGAHEEDPGAEDATRAGLAAARKSEVLPLAPAEAIDELWRGVDGRLLLADPDLVAIGVSTLDAPIAVIDARSQPARREGASVTYHDVRLSPPDGAAGRPRRHASLATSTAAEGAADAGPPLLLQLARGAAGLEAYELELYAGSGGRRRLSTIPLPVSDERPGVLGAWPERALDPGREYRAVHRLTVDGEERVFEVRFTTAEGP